MNRLTTSLFLRLLAASVIANAVLGIWALLSGDFGETQSKILGTSFLASAAMLSVLVNVPATRRRVLWPAPLAGATAGAAGFSLFSALVWAEPGGDFWFKLAGSVLVVSASATLASNLSMIGLPDRLRPLRWISNGTVALLSTTVLLGIWTEPDAAWYARLLGIEGVLVAATTLLIPVLARLSPSDPAALSGNDSPFMPAAIRFCPSCGAPVARSALNSGVPTQCSGCALAFEVHSTDQAGSTPDDGSRQSPAR